MEAQHFIAEIFNLVLKDHYYSQLTKNRVHSSWHLGSLRKKRKWGELGNKITVSRGRMIALGICLVTL
jgi:hypothetical protein